VWTDSWLSIAGVGCGLTGVGAGEEQARKVVAVRPPGVEKTSRLGSRNPVASRVKCGPHGGKNCGTKSWTVSWLSLKTKGEPGLCGSRVMSGDWWRVHRVHGVCSGSPENHWVTRLRHKTEVKDSTRRCGHPGRFNHPGGKLNRRCRSDRKGRSNRPRGAV
jgi:hypothetical protein